MLKPKPIAHLYKLMFLWSYKMLICWSRFAPSGKIFWSLHLLQLLEKVPNILSQMVIYHGRIRNNHQKNKSKFASNLLVRHPIFHGTMIPGGYFEAEKFNFVWTGPSKEAPWNWATSKLVVQGTVVYHPRCNRLPGAGRELPVPRVPQTVWDLTKGC